MARASIRDWLAASPVRLAPMASYTNVPFRQIALQCGSGFTTNEEIDADALVRDNARALRNAQPGDLGVVAMQLLGCTEETMVPSALRLVEAGADVVDINMGCPVQKIVKRGKGAALMRDVPATARLLTAIRRAIPDTPLTIKIRGGWSEEHQNAVEVARMAQDVGVDAITVHPRTRSQQYTGRAPWDVIADVVAAVDIPVTGNGDVKSLDDARQMTEQTGCVSVMIGRAALGRPWVFDTAYEALDDAGRFDYETDVVSRHLDLMESYFEPHEAVLQMKKHLMYYSRTWAGARLLRGELFDLKTADRVREVFSKRVRPVGELAGR
ncbi:MAG: tRNA-dihydrouridine synthase [Chloroflexi bacterium]|nr:tRNA-dihydrouridine synthase [Chloroflexota bacterium]